MKLLEGVASTPKAVFSSCELFRYTLWRTSRSLFATDFRGSRPRTFVNFICLNPSTATDDQDDPTVRKCQMLARRWGFDSICVTNIFAYRSTNPKALYKIDYPIGPMNDRYLMNVADRASLVVCAWGAHGELMDRAQSVVTLLRDLKVKLHYLRMGKKQPYHPLYLPYSTQPTEWKA